MGLEQHLSDVLLPRGTNIWEMSPGKLKTAALAFTFVVTAGYISMLAAGGLLAVLITGAVVTCCVLLTVLTCATLITLLVTGVPLGWAITRLLAVRGNVGEPRTRRSPPHGSRSAPRGGVAGMAAGLFGGASAPFPSGAWGMDDDDD